MSRLEACTWAGLWSVLLAGRAAAAEPTFTDVTAEAGVVYLQHRFNTEQTCIAGAVVDDAALCSLERLSGGAAVGDVDGDGFADLYVTRLDDVDILFVNRGDGTFEDRTYEAGLGGWNLHSNGAGFADLDNDGDLDLFVTTILEPRFYLFINDGSGRFIEAAQTRGVALPSPYLRAGFGVAFGDYDNDGWLDIHTTEWRPSRLDVGCEPSHARLLRNLGSTAPGYFEDVTESAGVVLERGEQCAIWAYASAFADFDGDGWCDLAVTGDFGSSRLFWNNGDGTFVDGTTAAGVGTDANGMGSTIGDYDGDGRLDWFVTAIYDPAATLASVLAPSWDGNRLYRNEGERVFSDQTDAAGVRDGGWGWGALFFDYDNDGDLDIAMTNGMDFLRGDHSGTGRFDGGPMRLWRNDGGTMTDVAPIAGLTDARNGKGILTFDYDNDGDLDLFVVNNGDTGVLYRNDGGNDANWLRVRVVGTRLNRDGIGARVTVTPVTGGPAQVREIGSSSHFLGQSERIAHFGLGDEDASVAKVCVDWPDGANVCVEHVEPNTHLTVVQPPLSTSESPGRNSVAPLPGSGFVCPLMAIVLTASGFALVRLVRGRDQ